MDESLKQAYQMVFDDLSQNCMFQGYYDAINGNPYFMTGVETVMEVIASRAYNEQYAENFADIFACNMAISKR